MLLTVAILLATFRIYIPQASLILLALSFALGLMGAGAMWLGLTQRSKEEIERLPEEVNRMETSTGILELSLIIVLAIAVLIMGSLFILFLLSA